MTDASSPSSTEPATAPESPLIGADDLARLIAHAERGGRPVRVLDVRWRLDRPDGRADFRAGHIPGAVYVDLDDELASHGAASEGRHPLPSLAGLQDAARGWGIDDGDTVVVYDDLASMSAARAWWLLRDAGIADVRVLDGALSAWTASGREVEEGERDVRRGDVTLGRGALPSIGIDTVAEWAADPDRVLVDVRAPERYRGDVEPIDPRAGHIPGAVNVPTAGNVDASGRFLAPAALEARFAASGIVPGASVAVYCGSGVTASHAALALTLAGFAPTLYPGSWSQWSNRPDRPIASGDQPA